MDAKGFKKELEESINRNGVDSYIGAPGFRLAEEIMIWIHGRRVIQEEIERLTMEEDVFGDDDSDGGEWAEADDREPSGDFPMYMEYLTPGNAGDFHVEMQAQEEMEQGY